MVVTAVSHCKYRKSKIALHQFRFGARLALPLCVAAKLPRARKANGASQRTNFKNRKVRMDTMKKTLVSLACTLALALGASAQTISFAELPNVTTPTILPNGFASLDWSGFYYVAPSWSGAGSGFRQGPAALNVAFVTCEAAAEIPCNASITS